MVLRLGIDTGGTFTDFTRVGPEGLSVLKLRSTPDDPSRAILEGIAMLAGAAAEADVVHGSTVATNAVLERKGARVALATTAGFEDVLLIGRQTRPQLYNIFVPARRPLVPPELVFGVRERMDAGGRVLVALDDSEIDTLAASLAGTGADICAVCFLHSYANPEHERRVAEGLRRRGVTVCTSHEVLPEYREFERWSTTVVNAYVTPLIGRYLGALEQRAGAKRLRIMQSNGGSISATAAREQAVRTILSGPAAGVVGAREVARAAGFTRLVSFDMGGTSTDVSLIDGVIATTMDAVVGDFPVRLPMIDIHTVGAGGGSIAAMDTGGALRVGPRSAGADPGPACYGTGEALTVTDANLLLGRLDAEFFLGGQMRLDVARAERVARGLAARLHLDVPALCEGIIRVANANMERAIRVVSVERGHDARDFTLVAFGGAGGMHACEIAERLEMATVMVPRYAGVLSALGMLVADVTKDYSASVLARADEIDLAEIARMLRPLVARATQDLRAEGFGTGEVRIDRRLDVRYVGQSYEITVPFSPAFRAAFDRRHLRTFGYADASRPVEIVNVRVVGAGLTETPRLPHVRDPRPSTPRPFARRTARFAGRRVRTSFFRWSDLRPGARAVGPSVITGGEATVVISPAFRFSVDGFGNVIATKR
jgi:N-methylhydantoinase A/oxoprolinase/acetone carboxylase beta subunit